jgi:uncharacterized protein DUF4396
LDLIVEYAAGFLFGLLIFQALFMRKTMGGTYQDNVLRSFLPELISMNLHDGGHGEASSARSVISPCFSPRSHGRSWSRLHCSPC